VKRRYLVLFITAPLVLLVAAPLAVVACTSSPAASPSSPLPPDVPAVPLDARLDTSTHVDPDAAPPPTCVAVDIPPGSGKTYCDLPGADATGLSVPSEFCIREFTTVPVTEARVIRFAPNGDLFLAAPSMNTPGGAGNGAGAILVLPDDNGDGKADSVLTFAGGSPRSGSNNCAGLEVDPANLACVHGLLFNGGYLYFTRSDEVRRVAYTPGARVAPAGPSELVATLGGAGISDVRWTHTLEQNKDGSIWVSRGRFDSSTCSPTEMESGAVFSLKVASNATLPVTPEVVANGFRNPMYLRCSPASCGECYTNELSGDGWDGVGGHEKLALLEKKGESWGYPCCVQRGVPGPTAGSADCSNIGQELVSIPLHDTPFGLDFDRGAFPGEYKHGIFVALHGVVSSFGGSGVVWIKTDPTSLRPATGEDALTTMFINGFGKTVGRATDVAFSPDGRMFVADDTSGKIYWVAPRTLAAPK
jgi:glucose/arabinose dehydrogenase